MTSAEETKADMVIDSPAEEISSKKEAVVQQGDRASNEKKFEELFEEGYKLFVAQNFNDAADKFSDAAELCVAIYGDFSEAGYKVHYYYGRTLVEIGRAKTLLVKPPAIDPESDTSDEDDVGEHNEEQISEAKVIVPDSEKTDQGSQTVEIEEPLKSDPIAANIEKPVDETLHTDQNDDGDGSEADNVAWQLLEVARNICEKQEQSTEWLERTADVRVALGECMFVDENFEKALEEFKAALAIQTQIFKPHHRRIAETLYHIGLTYKNNDDFEKAAEFFEKAGEVIQKAIEYEVSKSATNDKDSDNLVAELKTLVDDIKERVQDARESALSRQEQISFVTGILASVSGAAGSGDQVVNDITDQVRRGTKRAATTDESAPATTTSEETVGQQMNGEPVDKQLKLDDSKIDE